MSDVRGTDCDTYRCLAVTEVRERQVGSKWEAQKCDMKRVTLKKLNRVEVEQYQVNL
jgi:ribosome biogenesis protein Tsr3